MSVPDMRPQGSPDPASREGPGHELSDVKIRAIVLFGIGLVVLAVVVMVALGGVMGGFSSREKAGEKVRPALFADETGQFPAPRLEEDPSLALSRLRRDEKAALSSYGWVDRKGGVATIPIDRALEITARKGLPTRKAGSSPR